MKPNQLFLFQKVEDLIDYIQIKENCFFQNVEYLIAYLYTKEKNIPPLKLQKALYFLYAHYGSFYALKTKEKEERWFDYKLPKELFPVVFEAWNFGSVIKEVYEVRKSGEEYYQKLAIQFNEEDFFKSQDEKEVKVFIDEVFKQVIKTSDFSLVNRNQQDGVWKNAFSRGSGSVIDNERLIKEYREKYK